MDKSHTHSFEREGNYYVCSCGKTILAFDSKDGVRKGMRNNGMPYTKKSNVNRFLFPNEWMLIEDALPNKAKHTAKCLLHTGARINEIRQVNLKTDFIYNPQGRSRIILRHTKTKAKKGEFQTGKVRDIPLSKNFAKYLFNYLNNNPDGNLNIISTPGIAIALKKYAKSKGVKNPEDLSAHTLRKTLEVWLMSLGVDSLPLTAHLGHSIATASSNYVSPDIFSWEDKKKMRLILGDIYENSRSF
jgi:integrase